MGAADGRRSASPALSFAPELLLAARGPGLGIAAAAIGSFFHYMKVGPIEAKDDAAEDSPNERVEGTTGLTGDERPVDPTLRAAKAPPAGPPPLRPRG